MHALFPGNREAGNVELREIVDRYAEAAERIDVTNSHRPGVNARTRTAYADGFKALGENAAVRAIDETWRDNHPGELIHSDVDVRYPGLPANAKCDHVIGTPGQAHEEWGIEVKRLQHVGDNGKVNGYAPAKVLSPYLNDRGMLHDALRLREYGFTERVAIIGYCFDYDADSLAIARLRHASDAANAVIDEVQKVADGNGGHMRTRPLIEFADAILGLRGLTTGPRAEATFEAWRHPAGGRGIVFGWEVRRPQLEPDYDPRHPW